MSESYFFHVFEQKVLMSEFCFTFSFNYCYYWLWVVGTANINFVLTLQRKLLHGISPTFMLGDATISLKFWKVGIGEFKEFLPHIFTWGAYHAPCQKILCNIKHGFEGSISNVDMTCFSQATNWCLVLWDFGSVKSLNSVQNLLWHSKLPRHIYVFSIFLGKNNAKAIKFLWIIITTFPRIRKYILLFKKKKKCFTQ